LSRRSNSSRRGRRRGGGRDRSEAQSKIAGSVQLTCIRCGKNIRNPQMALATPENEPIHFDCAIQEVAEAENLGAREKICYLGQGSFGIIKFKSGSSNRDFSIRKRIPYEKAEQSVSWRKEMREKLDFGR